MKTTTSNTEMGSNEEDQNFATIPAKLDPTTTTTTPLLSHPYPNPGTGTGTGTGTGYLHITYNQGPRPFQDIPFLFLFLLLVCSTFSFGIFSVFHRNSSYSSLSSFSYSSSSSSCVSSASSSLSLPLSSSFLLPLILVLLLSSFLSLPISFSLLLLLRHYPKHLVYTTLPFLFLLPIFFNLYWFVSCTLSSTCTHAFPLGYRILLLVFFFLIIGLVVWIFIVNWHRVDLTIRIIAVASDALSRNLGLFGVLPFMSLLLLVYYVPIVMFLVYARQNGSIVPKESDGGYTCVWKQDSWVPAYFALALLTMLWSFTVSIEAQLYLISGTIAQWYFSKEEDAPPRRIRSSLRNAFGPSSGTICLSGLLNFIVRIVRAVVDSTKSEDAPGFVNVVLRCCVNTFLSIVDFVNKFTIGFAAITGESYCASSRMTYELLRRNLLSAAFVETISTRLLGGIVFVLSAIYAIVVCAILKGASSIGVDSYYLSVLAWAILMLVLGFFVHVLDNVIDTVYVCYAIDRDRGEVCKQDVHEVYVGLPLSRNSRLSLASHDVRV
ncbi:hypothetical protein MLD38_031275 [Melastoma candidum]|uniref:Uncharacterized protein n=1 Tax=Melastoma candidum TaxID=119954 RepID=A0ACB9MP68_9MYRT|nr:hypothetical protein MLD38_031275 [Melastoma candidum]